jgi:hypothetical protein
VLAVSPFFRRGPSNIEERLDSDNRDSDSFPKKERILFVRHIPGTLNETIPWLKERGNFSKFENRSMSDSEQFRAISVIEVKVCIENFAVILPCGKTAANLLVHRGAINAVTRARFRHRRVD